ncbi:phosphate signaling complex protein PhoU [Methanomethylovorans sp.]|uniref:phosphate signaling complex protein PhoU n=1 Tax=Methanomethylovorans sp. TaxID=2758717 RepID=UPI002FDD30E0
MSREKYQRNLEILKANTIEMAVTSLDMVKNATLSLKKLDKALAEETISMDDIVDEHEMMIDKCVSNLITLQQPMAGDMRLITSCLTMAIDLERLSDLASNIAWVTLEVEGEIADIEPLLSRIFAMGSIAEKMLEDTIVAFQNSDAELAKRITEEDDKLDKLFFENEKQYIEIMNKNNTIISDASHLLFVLRYMERIGDHVCNLCQSIVYLVTAERVRLN